MSTHFTQASSTSYGLCPSAPSPNIPDSVPQVDCYIAGLSVSGMNTTNTRPRGYEIRTFPQQHREGSHLLRTLEERTSSTTVHSSASHRAQSRWACLCGVKVGIWARQFFHLHICARHCHSPTLQTSQDRGVGQPEVTSGRLNNRCSCREEGNIEDFNSRRTLTTDMGH